jgi:hypothetical protein
MYINAFDYFGSGVAHDGGIALLEHFIELPNLGRCRQC